MAKVPEPGSLTLRSEDWSVDCNPKSVSINGTLIQIPNGVTYQLYIYIYSIYIYTEYVQNYTNRNPICIYIYIRIFLNLYIYIYTGLHISVEVGYLICNQIIPVPKE